MEHPADSPLVCGYGERKYTGINAKMNAGSACEILKKYISGYHEYALEDPVHILYAGESRCSILRMTPEELTSPLTDMLFPSVHPADGDAYQAFLKKMAEEERTASCEFRLMTGGGQFRRYAVSMTSSRREDGRMTGYGVLAEIEREQRQMETLQFINDTVPCGLLRYTCEKIPRITYVNDTMLELMRIPPKSGDGIDPLELYTSNIYMRIAEESRGRFSTVLREVFLQGKPHAGEISVLRGDGSRGRLFGWVTKRIGADGREEFQSICMDVTNRYRAKQSEQTESYLHALSCAYDMIFEFDTVERTVRYLQGSVPFFDGFFKNVPMDLTIATQKWLNALVVEEDRPALSRFLVSNVLRQEKEKIAASGTVGRPAQQENRRDNASEDPQITFRMREGDGGLQEYNEYNGIILRTGMDRLWFCCSALAKEQKAGMAGREPGQSGKPRAPHVKIRTFGYFDVFVDGRPVMFRHEKAKELLALLVDRQGGYISSEEAISFLWEDEPASPVVLSRYRKVSMRLKNILEEYGIAQIVESVNGKRRIVPEAVDCDLYVYLSQEAASGDLFTGSYLTNYSWGETTLGDLLMRRETFRRRDPL